MCNENKQATKYLNLTYQPYLTDIPQELSQLQKSYLRKSKHLHRKGRRAISYIFFGSVAEWSGASYTTALMVQLSPRPVVAS